MTSKQPHPVDRLVGSRVRLIRTARGFSQSRLAENLGITFQQVQKYEKGTNRISASRLFEISRLLGVSVPDLYAGADDTAPSPLMHPPTHCPRCWITRSSGPCRGSTMTRSNARFWR